MFRLRCQSICEQINKVYYFKQPVKGAFIKNGIIQIREQQTMSIRERMAGHKFKKNKKEEEIPQDYLKWVLLAIPVASFGLGCWQVRRRQWKLNLIKTLKESSECPPIELPENLDELKKLEYRPVKVKGHFIHEKELLMGPRSLIQKDDKYSSGSFFRDHSKGNGYLVITPFKLSDRKEIILVNRGWVPTKIKNQSKRKEGQIEDEVELTGVVRLHENRGQFMPINMPEKGQWMYRDLKMMSQITGSEPVFIDARGMEDMPDGWPIPNQTRIVLRNEHFSYIVTWYTLCGFTSWMWIRQFIQKLPLL